MWERRRSLLTVGLSVFLWILCFSQVTTFCGEGEIRCVDGTCIPISKVRDGIRDCPKGMYDEVGPICNSSELHCANGTCLPREKFQDGVGDCLDNSDEVILVGHRCTGEELPCCTCDVYVNNSVCWDGTCNCQDGYYSNELGTDCILREIDDVCENDTDCSGAVNNSYCTDSGLCACDLGYKASQDRSACLKREINDYCTEDTECSSVIGQSECQNETCACVSGYFPVPDRDRCQLRLLGEACEEQSDCFNAIGNSQCEDGFCWCESGFKSDANDTVCTRLLIGDKCINDTDCSDAVESSHCVNGTCACLTGYKDGGGGTSCLQRNIDDACISDDDCFFSVPDSECIDGACACSSGHQVNVSKDGCVRRKIGDKTCKIESDCSDAVNDSYCERGECKCSDGHYQSPDKTHCIRRKIYDRCQRDSDCTGAVLDSECSFLRCKCLPGYYSADDDTSCRRRKIGDNCTRDFQCTKVIDLSKCVDGHCRCREGFEVGNNLTTCTKRGIGSSCSLDEDCNEAVDNTKCTDGFCACQPGYKMSYGTDCKLRPSRIGHPCRYNNDCYLEVRYSKCKGPNRYKLGTCVCLDHRFSDREGTKCTVLPKKLGHRCGLEEHCRRVDQLANCTAQRICDCDESSVFSEEDGFCILPKKLGEPCERTEHCLEIDALAVCLQDGTCHCDDTSVPSYKNTSCIRTKAIQPCVLSQQNDCKEVKPDIPDLVLGNICNINETGACPMSNATYQWCRPELGRTNTRCRCRPGFAQKYNEADCHEAQTYYIRINITEESMCFARVGHAPYCPAFHPFNYIKQYSNANTKPFMGIKLRISVLGLDYMLNTSEHLEGRYVSSEILNMTRIDNGLQVQAILNVQEDIYDVIPPETVSVAFLEKLNESMGVLGTSRLKIGLPLDDNVFISDFDECEDQGGKFMDCDPRAWCINTNGSYMCSCKYEWDDRSPNRDKRAGRVCGEHVEPFMPDFTCSEDSCKAKMECKNLYARFLSVNPKYSTRGRVLFFSRYYRVLR
ncbi:hypothetical protein ScPMuIL_013179 [Solemya velum]